jgi:hypothetical protein
VVSLLRIYLQPDEFPIWAFWHFYKSPSTNHLHFCGVEDRFERISPGADQRYTTKDIHKAICGDIHSKRQRLLDAQAQRIELEIEQTRSKLIDREVVYKMHERIFIALRQTVLASGLTDIEKSEMLKEMRRGIQLLPATW